METIVEMQEEEEINTEEILLTTWQKLEVVITITEAITIIKKMKILEITFKRLITILNKTIKTHQIKSLKQLSADILICTEHATMVTNAHMLMEIMNSEQEIKLISIPPSHNSNRNKKDIWINKFINKCSHKCLFLRLKINPLHKQFIIRKW